MIGKPDQETQNGRLKQANLIYPQLPDRTMPKLLTGKLKSAHCTLVQTLVNILCDPITGKISGGKVKVCLVGSK